MIGRNEYVSNSFGDSVSSCDDTFNECKVIIDVDLDTIVLTMFSINVADHCLVG